MEDIKSERTIEESDSKTAPLDDILKLKPGVVFIPTRQIGEWKEPYLVVKERESFFLCIRLSFHDESLAGPYDIIAEDYIIEAWNAFALPKNAGIKGYEILPEEILKAVSSMRTAWVNGEKTSIDYPTGEDILSSADKLLFHEAELQANESLQKAWNEGADQFPSKPLWKRPTQNADISDAFEELDGLVLNGNLFATVFPPGYILFSWKTDLKMPPPEIYIRDCGRAWITSSDWKEMDSGKKWDFAATIPERAKSLVLRMGETECLLEVLPLKQKISSESPLFLALFEAFKKAEVDFSIEISSGLLEYQFSSLEKQALEYGKHLNRASDQICFLLTHALCSEVLSHITRLYLFHWAEEKLNQKNMGAEGRTVFGRDILSKVQTFKEGGYTQTEWFYKAVYSTWHKELTRWKDQIDKSMYYEEEEIEEAVGDLLVRYESWQSRLSAFATDLSDVLAGKWADVSGKLGVWLDEIASSSNIFVPVQSYARPQSSSLPQGEEDDSAPLQTSGLKTVQISNPEDWHGIFSRRNNTDDDMEKFLEELDSVWASYFWGGIKITPDGAPKFILSNVVEQVPDNLEQGVEIPANDCILMIVGVCSDPPYLKSTLERLEVLGEKVQETNLEETTETGEPIIWIAYTFPCNVPK